jgi:hypothetical protein
MLKNRILGNYRIKNTVIYTSAGCMKVVLRITPLAGFHSQFREDRCQGRKECRLLATGSRFLGEIFDLLPNDRQVTYFIAGVAIGRYHGFPECSSSAMSLVNDGSNTPSSGLRSMFTGSSLNMSAPRLFFSCRFSWRSSFNSLCSFSFCARNVGVLPFTLRVGFCVALAFRMEGFAPFFGSAVFFFHRDDLLILEFLSILARSVRSAPTSLRVWSIDASCRIE